MAKTILKKRVYISTWNAIFTIIAVGAVACTCITQFKRTDVEAWVWIFLSFILVWGFLTLFYCPMYVRLTEDSLNVDTSLRVKKFPLNEITAVKICPPTMAEKSVIGCRCSFGYWGWFREPSIGKYFAYYGLASQTFLIRLKSGRQYMLGCRDAKEMAKELGDALARMRNNL
ncbi:MAG: PH domain-containing protein [Muribaculaceae bacterium]|nr:PH domain-containing protein [Muribaculaceae bacterium]